MLLLRKPWDSQPQEVTAGDPNFPSNLLFNAATGPYNLALSQSLQIVGTPTRQATKFGVAAGLSSGNRFQVTRPQTGLGRNVTFVAVVQLNSVGSFPMVISANNGGTDIAELRFFSNTGFAEFTIKNSVGYSTARGAINYAGAGPICLIGVTPDGGRTEIYVDGVLQATGSQTTADIAWGTNDWAIGDRGVSAGFPLTGNISLAAVLPFALSSGQAADIGKNPWQLFAPRSIWVPVSTSGGGTTYTITPSGGITFAGDGTEVNGKVITPTGGVTFAGTGSATFTSGGTSYVISPTGGITFAGVGTQVKSKTIIPTGGISFAGSGLGLRTKIVGVSGGVTFSGTGNMTSNTSSGTGQTGERTKVGVGT